MITEHLVSTPALLDEHSTVDFRRVFGGLLSRSSSADTAILRIRLGAVDLSSEELAGIRKLRVLVAEANAQAVEGEVYAMAVDPTKRANLQRVLGLLREDVLEIRSSPLGGWSPDFSVFLNGSDPHGVLVGPHWFHRPFPHRGPAWAARFGAAEARRAARRFHELWTQAHDIGSAIHRLMEQTSARTKGFPVDTPNSPG